MGSCENWHAWYDFMPGRPPMLHVTAECTLPSAEHSVKLERDVVAEGSPSIVGPSVMARSLQPPTFQVDTGENPFYVVEVATEPELLKPGSQRPPDKFYGTWQDNKFFAGRTFTLEPMIWDQLKNADRLYYRIVTSASTVRFVEAVPSTPASQVHNAPYIMLFDPSELPDEANTLVLRLSIQGPDHPPQETSTAVTARYREPKGDVRYDCVIIKPMGLKIPCEDVF
jgi:hypothetical protein